MRAALREGAGGLAVTAAVHGVVLAALLSGHRAAATPRVRFDDDRVIRVKMVRKGRPRPERLLPRHAARVPVAPKPKTLATREPPPAPADRPEPKPPDPAPADTPPGRSLSDAASRIAEWDQRFDDADPEGSPDGVEGATDTESAGDPYIQAVVAAILGQWQVPDLVKESELRVLTAGVLVRTDDTGRILEHSIVEGSGNRFFDASVVDAVARLGTLPPPPPRWAGLLAQGVIFDFQPGVRPR